MENEKIKNAPDFSLLPAECSDPEISESDFVLSAKDKKIHDQKFQTRPTTFLKDSIKRFAKNKSSLVAAGILGVLLLLSFVIPIVDTSDVAHSHPEMIYLEPKLFNAGTGFWDGTKKWTSIPTDMSAMPNATTEEEKQENWWPNPLSFEKNGVTKKKFSDLSYTDTVTPYGNGGYVQIGYYNDIESSTEYISFTSRKFTEAFNANEDCFLTVFDTFDETKLKSVENLTEEIGLPENYSLGQAALYFNYTDGMDPKSVMLIDYASVHNVGSTAAADTGKVNISEILRNDTSLGGKTSFTNASFSIRVKNEENHKNTCVLLRSIAFDSQSTNAKLKNQINSSSILEASSFMNESATKNNETNFKYWSSTGVKKVYMSRVVFCSFVYDSYEAKLGTKLFQNFPVIKLESYYEKGWIDWYAETYQNGAGDYVLNKESFVFTILNSKKCPIAEEFTADDIYVDPNSGDLLINCQVTYYKYYGYSKMPTFLMGTDKTGRDMLKYVFEGLRTSLLLGILTFIVCFLFGLFWGAISGYFGGTVDLLMERFTDILSGVPWIVVMTLVIIHMGSNFWTFALALCLTGWIGTAATTRTQFYRFRGREYVLASRTLGANDFRLIFKHILPNAMGTIITGAVLMIPSVIFSEATISYLGLGLKNLSSLGVILSNNQSELLSNSYLLIFPSIIIALLMISFNLAGNGLRDAVNPSLKGEGE